jgi:protease PrsW
MILNSLSAIVGAAAIVPALLVLWLVIVTDRRPEPPRLVWTTFLLGVGSIFLLRYARLPFEPFLHITDSPSFALPLHVLFGVAMPEETVKILVITAFAARQREFEEPMDGIVYGAAAGLGFAAYENLGYLVHHTADWQMLAVIRGFLTVPFHAALGVIAGAYIARLRFGSALGGDRYGLPGRAWWMMSIWLVPVVLHALFDFSLFKLRESPAPNPVIYVGLGLLVGFGTIALAARLTLRTAARQKSLRGVAHVQADAWRAIWALLVVGGGAGFAGAILLFSQAQNWFKGVGWDAATSAAGILLLLIAVLIYRRGSRYITQDRQVSS